MSDIETYERATRRSALGLLLECGFIPVARDNQDVFARWHYSQLAHDGTDPEQPAPEPGLPAQN